MEGLVEYNFADFRSKLRHGKDKWIEWCKANPNSRFNFFKERIDDTSFIKDIEIPFPVSFESSDFQSQAVFYNVKFLAATTFKRASARHPLIFKDCDFEGSLNIDLIICHSDLTFFNCNSRKDIRMLDSTIHGNLNFSHFDFPSLALQGSVVYEDLNLIDCTFSSIYLDSIEIKNNFRMKRLTILGKLSAKESKFNNFYYINDCIIEKANFFGSETPKNITIKNTTFNSPPVLEDVIIGYQCIDTSNFKVKFKTSTDTGFINRFKASSKDDSQKYRILKNHAIANSDHDNEQLYFSYELRAKRYYQHKFLSLVLSFLYEWTCDFGQSILRPILLLLATWLGFASIFYHHSTYGHVGDSLLLSTSNLLPFLGHSRATKISMMEKLFENEELMVNHLHSFMFIENITGIILIFLVGLGFRNRFKL